MREKADYVILSFAKTTDAMAMENYCAKQHLPGRMIPLPREISAGCGLAWRVPKLEYEAYKNAYPDYGPHAFWEHELRM